MLDLLNQNSGSFVVIFSTVVAVATAAYAMLTWQLVSETRRMRKVQTEPKVSVVIQPNEAYLVLMDMTIHNIGLGPAYKVKFELEPDFEFKKSEFLSNLSLMRNGLEYLAPKQKLQLFLTSMFENYDKKRNSKFQIEVTYEDSSKNSYRDRYLIDFSPFANISRMGMPPLNKIAENIEYIRKNIDKLVTGFQKLRVITYTKKEIEEEQKKYLDDKE